MNQLCFVRPLLKVLYHKMAIMEISMQNVNTGSSDNSATASMFSSSENVCVSFGLCYPARCPFQHPGWSEMKQTNMQHCVPLSTEKESNTFIGFVLTTLLSSGI